MQPSVFSIMKIPLFSDDAGWSLQTKSTVLSCRATLRFYFILLFEISCCFFFSNTYHDCVCRLQTCSLSVRGVLLPSFSFLCCSDLLWDSVDVSLTGRVSCHVHLAPSSWTAYHSHVEDDWRTARKKEHERKEKERDERERQKMAASVKVNVRSGGWRWKNRNNPPMVKIGKWRFWIVHDN